MGKIYTVFEGTDREFSGYFKDICKHFNFKYYILYNRVHNQNMTIEEAIDYKTGLYKYHEFTVFKNSPYEFTGNKTEIAKHFNINYNYLLKYINRNNSKDNNNNNSNIEINIENAIRNHIEYENKRNIKKDKENKIYTVFKNIYDNKNGFNEFTGTLNEICQHFNINKNIINYRMNKYNLSLEESISFEEKKDERKNKKAIKYTIFKGTNREFTGNRKDIAKYFNVSYNMIINNTKNINNNDNNSKDKIEKKIEEVINCCINNYIYYDRYYNINKNVTVHTVFKGIDKNNPIVDKINNKEYYEFTGTIEEICNNFGFKYNTIYKRMSRCNISFEEAINFEENRNKKKYIIFKDNKLNHKEFIGNKNQICKYYNISNSFLNNYIKKHGHISISKAFENIILKREKENDRINNIQNYVPTYKDENGKVYIIFINNNNNNNSDNNFKTFIGTKKQIADEYKISYKNLLKNIKKYSNNNNKTIESIIEETIVRVVNKRNKREKERKNE